MAEQKTKPTLTPGNWRVFVQPRLRKQFDSPPVVEIQTDLVGVPIVNWSGFDESLRPHEEHVANARCMAASKDLLKCLHHDSKHSVANLLRSHGYEAEADQIDAAIAKATS